jgi:hypothetical protein
MSNGVLDVIFPEPDAVVRMINDLRDMNETNPPNYHLPATDSKVQHASNQILPAANGSSTDLRCFVALASNPSSKKVIKINPGMPTEQFFVEIASKLQLNASKFRLELLVDGGERVEIDSPSDVSANDTILATPC